MQLYIKRSDEWVSKQRLETGENVPRVITVDCDPAALSVEARGILLAAGAGEYREELLHLAYNDSYEVMYDNSGRCGSYGHADFEFNADAHELSDAMLSVVIISAMAEVLADKAEGDKRKAEREAARAEKAAADAAEAETKRIADEEIAAARKILAKVIQSLENKIEQAGDNNRLLSRLLQAIPADAKRGAIRSMLTEDLNDSMESMQQRLESAADTIHILTDLDEDEDDD